MKRQMHTLQTFRKFIDIDNKFYHRIIKLKIMQKDTVQYPT